jgi:hypothetical protein
MSHHLHLFIDYHSIRLADFPAESRPSLSPTGTGSGEEMAEPGLPALLHMSWIESHPATQQRFARVGLNPSGSFVIDMKAAT